MKRKKSSQETKPPKEPETYPILHRMAPHPTVKDLIELLSTLNPELPICILDTERDEVFDVHHVIINRRFTDAKHPFTLYSDYYHGSQFLPTEEIVVLDY